MLIVALSEYKEILIKDATIYWMIQALQYFLSLA